VTSQSRLPPPPPQTNGGGSTNRRYYTVLFSLLPGRSTGAPHRQTDPLGEKVFSHYFACESQREISLPHAFVCFRTLHLPSPPQDDLSSQEPLLFCWDRIQESVCPFPWRWEDFLPLAHIFDTSVGCIYPPIPPADRASLSLPADCVIRRASWVSLQRYRTRRKERKCGTPGP
jgi:hypothetical protein